MSKTDNSASPVLKLYPFIELPCLNHNSKKVSDFVEDHKEIEDMRRSAV